MSTSEEFAAQVLKMADASNPQLKLALAKLAEIAQYCMDRMMERGENAVPEESFALGSITGMAIKVPGVLDLLKTDQEAKELAEIEEEQL
jgi:hypothetical protein